MDAGRLDVHLRDSGVRIRTGRRSRQIMLEAAAWVIGASSRTDQPPQFAPAFGHPQAFQIQSNVVLPSGMNSEQTQRWHTGLEEMSRFVLKSMAVSPFNIVRKSSW